MGSTAAPIEDKSGDACVICLSAVTERAIASPCNHATFDFVCLVSWLHERPTCPLCKAAVKAVQYDWRSPKDYKSYAVHQSHPPSNAPHSRAEGSRSLLPGRRRAGRRTYSPPVVDAALRKRRAVYQKKLYSLHVGSNSLSGYRDLDPQAIAGSPELQSRARAWIRRELRVFPFLNNADSPGPSTPAAPTSSNAEFLLSYIVSMVKMIDIKASNGHAENLLAEFLGRENSQLFLHELQAWLRSPFPKLEEWDQQVQYSKEIG